MSCSTAGAMAFKIIFSMILVAILITFAFTILKVCLGSDGF